MSEELTLPIPTINDGRADFARLFHLWQQCSAGPQTIRLDFSACRFLRPNAVAFLGGLARLLESRNTHVLFDWRSMSDEAVMATLKQNGFAATFGYPSPGWSGETVPYREDRQQDAERILNYLTDYWLGRGWVRVSPMLQNAIVGKVWEIYANAFEHAESSIGVFSCGSHFRRNNELVLSVVDFGRGIVRNVRNHLRSDPRAPQLPAKGCLRWAFSEGTTTRPDGVRRGVGLDILKDFIHVNNGTLEAYSNDGYALVNKDGDSYEDRTPPFDGTILHITLQCDEKYYQFAREDGLRWPS